MEGEEIGMVLARASELKTKFSDCILNTRGPKEEDGSSSLNTREDDDVDEQEEEEEKEEEEEEEEAEGLVNIRDAFEALEQQLSALQDLQLQQRYEREASLFQIDRSRKILLSKLKEYKGDDLEVIHEALTFAGGTLSHDEDLLLPPYPGHLPDLFVTDDLYPSSHFTSKYRTAQNGLKSEAIHKSKKSMDVLGEKPYSNKPGGVRLFFGLLAKSVIAVVGVASVLSLAGFKPELRKDGIKLKIHELFQRPTGEVRESPTECPPGKVLVIEEGQPRCLVKERVEIPFDADVTSSKINYGFG